MNAYLAGSIAICFGRNQYNKFLARNFVPDEDLQMVSERFSQIPAGAPLDGDLATMLDELVAAFNREYESRIDKYRGMRRTFQHLRQRCGQREEASLFMFRTDSETERFASMRMKETSSLYQPSERVSREVIDAIAPSAEETCLRNINVRLEALGYTAEMTSEVLDRKFDRRAVHELTQAQASYFLSYLNSPSGVPAKCAARPGRRPAR